MAYLGKTPSQAVRSRYYFTATGGETSLSGTDDNSNTLTFTDGNYVDVYLNGVLLVAATDYNTTTANTIAGLSALTASDVVEVVVYDTFSVFSGNFNGDINLGDNVKANFGAGNDLQIYHTGSTSYIYEQGTGDLRIRGSQVRIEDDDGSTLALFKEDAGVELRYDGAVKLESTSTGVDVTGAVDIAITSNQGLLIDATAGNNAYLTITNGGSNTGSKIGFDNASNATVIGHHTFGNILYASSSGKVGIGTSSPQYKLSVSNNGGNGLEVRPDFSGDTETRINSYNRSGGSYTTLSFDTGVVKFRQFGTSDAVTIDSSGILLVGKTATNYQSVGVEAKGNGSLWATADQNGALIVTRKTNDGLLADFYKDTTKVGSIGSTDFNGSKPFIANPQANGAGLGFYTNAIFPTNSSGAPNNGVVNLGIPTYYQFNNLYLSGGVYLGGSGSANKLDDYEEGTWTGTLKGLTTDPSVAVQATGEYTKIGRMVYVQIKFSNVNNTGASGDVYVNGLPFTVNTANAASGNCAAYNFDFPNGRTNISVQVATSGLYPYVSGDSLDWRQLIHAPGTGRYLEISAQYTVA